MTGPIPIRWAPGTRPTEAPIHRVYVRSLIGGPYLLSDQQHTVLHHEGEPHRHASPREGAR